MNTLNFGFQDEIVHIKIKDKLNSDYQKNFNSLQDTYEYENAKHKLGENICKIYVTDLYPEYIF